MDGLWMKDCDVPLDFAVEAVAQAAPTPPPPTPPPPTPPPRPPHTHTPVEQKKMMMMMMMILCSPLSSHPMCQGREVSKCDDCDGREVSLQSVGSTQKVFRGVK